MRIKKIWKKILYHYRWFRYGDPSPVSVDQKCSPEVIDTKFKISALLKYIVLVKKAIISMYGVHSQLLNEAIALIPDKLVNSSATRNNYYKYSINNLWKNASSIIDDEHGFVRVKISCHYEGMYFFIGRNILSASNGSLSISIESGSYKKTLLAKHLEALHQNWDLFSYSFDQNEKKTFQENGYLDYSWKTDSAPKRIFITPPILQNSKKQNKIVVFVADGVCPMDIGVYGSEIKTPNIDALFSEGAVFLNSYSQSNWTLPTFASMATSLYPSQHNIVNPDGPIRVLSRDELTLAEILRNEGFVTYGDFAHRRCNQSLGHHRGFDSFYYKQHTNDGDNMSKQINRAINFYQNIKGVSLFMFIHFFDTHSPYCFLSEGMVDKYLLIPKSVEYYMDKTLSKTIGSDQHGFIKDRYMKKLLQLDNRLYEFIDELRNDPEATVFFTSDHGTSFNKSDADTLVDSNIRTPFMVYSNKFQIEGGRFSNMVESSIDLLPTITSLLGIDKGMQRSGSSVYNCDLSLNSKEYALSELMYKEKYELKITDINGSHVVISSNRNEQSYEIDLNNFNITEYNTGKGSAIEYGKKLATYIEKSRLNKELKDSLCKAVDNFA
jgi:hypothetical protein